MKCVRGWQNLSFELKYFEQTHFTYFSLLVALAPPLRFSSRGGYGYTQAIYIAVSGNPSFSP